MSDIIYLDYNATTPVDPRVREAMEPFLGEEFGNPSSSHGLGKRAREAVDQARAELAALINAYPDEILFTSGGSESNNAVIFGLAEEAPVEKRHVITSTVEHPAVVEPCRLLERRGWRVSWLPVDERGIIDTADLAAALCEETALVSIMLANNEVGAIQPVKEAAWICRAEGVPFHTDAAQAVGKIPVDVRDLAVDFLSLAGHKLYAPKGVGALFIKRGCELPPFIRGAGQESGRRAGTENVSQIVGLGAAAVILRRKLEGATDHPQHALDHESDEDFARDLLLHELSRYFSSDRMRVNGPLSQDPELCLPNTLSVSFKGLRASDLLTELEDRLAASAGAACNVDGTKVSSVLTAMGVPLEWAMGTLRFSVGRMMTDELTIRLAAEILVESIEQLASRE